MLGVSYFSFLMGQSMDILNSYNSKLGTIDASDEIYDWANKLGRFDNKQACIPVSLQD